MLGSVTRLSVRAIDECHMMMRLPLHPHYASSVWHVGLSKSENEDINNIAATNVNSKATTRTYICRHSNVQTYIRYVCEYEYV